MNELSIGLCLCVSALSLACAEPDAASIDPAAAAGADEQRPADAVAPAFSPSAILIATAPGRLDSEPRAVVLRWEAASDDEGVVAYVVRVDGQEVARVDAPAEQATVEGVAFESARAFSLVAVDEAGNASSALTTDDALAPWFSDGAEIQVESEDGQVRLRWPAADDDVGVVSYSVQSGQDELASLEPSVRSHRLEADSARSPHSVRSLSVVATDAAGHKTRLAASPQAERTQAQLEAERADAQVALILGRLASDPGFSDVLEHGDLTGDDQTGDSPDLLAQAAGVGMAQGASAGQRGGGGLGGTHPRPTGGQAASVSDFRPLPSAPRARGRVSVSAAEPEPGGAAFDANVVTRRLRARQRVIQSCYERALRADPTLAGRIVLRFTITERGMVREASAAESTIGSPATVACVTGIVRRLRFHPVPEGVVTYRATVELSVE